MVLKRAVVQRSREYGRVRDLQQARLKGCAGRSSRGTFLLVLCLAFVVFAPELCTAHLLKSIARLPQNFPLEAQEQTRLKRGARLSHICKRACFYISLFVFSLTVIEAEAAPCRPLLKK